LHSISAGLGVSITARVRGALRPLYKPFVQCSPALTMLMHVPQGVVKRTRDYVNDEFSGVWSRYGTRLDACTTYDQWMCIPGFDDKHIASLIDGRARWAAFDHTAFKVDAIVAIIAERFPEARSITEYGCGVGRNLLGVKRRMPQLACYGYELTDVGVAVATRAAEKFGLDVKYAKLDYVDDGPSSYTHPMTDLALTVYSLEQVPGSSCVAVQNMLAHSKLGSIHIEAPRENYPRTYRGAVGRLYSYTQNHFAHFDDDVRSLDLRAVHKAALGTAPHPLVYPSTYALVK
jgi:hypothetical protein